MQYRKLSASGDYTFGQGSLNFYSGVEAVAQAVKTRLQLYEETFWRDLSDGVPMFQKILASPGSVAHVAAIDGIIQSRISDTEGVTALLDFSSSFDPAVRKYSFQATIQTQYSVTVVSGTI